MARILKLDRSLRHIPGDLDRLLNLTVVLKDNDAYLPVTALGGIARARGRSEIAKPWGLPARMNRM